ncbi:alpha/beta hydrolase family protein [Pleomorphovibrio marinus]|uniref:alpha/beta hydrolase family protein n=1 Tax=Pleomorphovibrio marinus TaxID=2164132 RepID=UPI000E0A1555|nr:S9 family peptidase [Pleomorphovibrio marinus]
MHLIKGILNCLFLFLIYPASLLLAQSPTPLEDLDVFQLQYAGAPEISPEGDQIVYVRHQFDIMKDKAFSNLWMIEANGEGHQPLTSGKNNIGNAKWSPSGERLAYVSNEEGSSQIMVIWLNSGHKASITNLVGSPGNLEWSPDGKWIAFTTNVPASSPSIGEFPKAPKGAEWAEPAKIIDYIKYRSDGNFGFVEPGYSHIFIVNAEGGAPRQLTSGNFNHNSFSWLPNSEGLVISANRSEKADLAPKNSHLYRLSIKDNSLQQLTAGRGPYENPKVSADGKKIAYTWYEDEFVGYQLSDIYTMNIDGSQQQKLQHGLGLDLDAYSWAGDGKSLNITYTKEGQGHLANLDLKGNVKVKTDNIGGASLGRPYSSGSASFSKNGDYAFTHSLAERPSEIAVGTGGKERVITQINDTFLKGKKLGKVEEIWYPSSFDGKNIQGWIIYPPDFDSSKKYPLILEIHGGPYLSYGPHFTPELQLMAAKGYVVLYTNPRGSTSYGEEFAAYINNNYPSEDFDDLISGVDHVVKKGFVDEDNLFITGGSGGGVLSSWAIGKTDRFRAAVVSKPVINWYSFVLTADGVATFYKYWFDAKPWEDPEQYLKRSPISLVGNVKTPTMVVVGENDYRTPISQSEEYYNALQIQGVESMLVRLPGASHNLTARPSNLIRHVGYILGWFEKHKK